MNQWNGYPGQPPQQGFPQQPQQGFPQPQPQQGFPQPPQAQYAPPPAFGAGNNPFAALGLNGADPTGSRLPYFEPGNYLVTVDKITFKTSRQGKNLYIIECVIDQSNNPSLPAGTKASQLIDMSNRDMSGINIKRFLSAALGFDPETEIQMPPDAGHPQPWVWSAKMPFTPDGRAWDQLCFESCQGGQPLKGMKLALTAVNTKTKSDSDFTLHLWKPYKEVAAPSNPAQFGMAAPAFNPNAPQQPQAPSFNPNVPQQAPPGWNPPR